MRVIDLLNKIENDEQVPKMIIYKGEKYCINNCNYTYWKVGSTESDTLNIDTSDLNDEIEIIEEPQEHKIPEKIEYTFNLGFIDINDKDLVIKEVNKTINDLYKKYNEIIDYLEKINEK